MSGGNVEIGVHVELEAAVEVDVGLEQGGQAAPLGVNEAVPPGRIAQHDLNHDGVDVAEGGLDQVDGQGGDLGVLPVGAGEIAALAVEDVGVRGVPVSTTCRPSRISRRGAGSAR